MKETYRESAEVISRAWPDWEIRDLIGTGAFATVYRASRRERIPGEKDSAIKIIRIPHVDTDWDRMLAEGKTPEQTEDFFQRIENIFLYQAQLKYGKKKLKKLKKTLDEIET